MIRIPLALTLVMIFCTVASAQSKGVECPKITVIGPAEVFLPGETIIFTVSLKNAEQLKLKFFWTVENGKIESGQGTQKLVVRLNPEIKWEAKERATVEIEGLPAGCPNTASEQATTAIDRAATMLDVMGGPLGSIPDSRFRTIADALRDEPNAQLYAFVPPDKQIRSVIYERLSKVLPGLDPSRVTYGDNETIKSSAEFWIVYPGTTPPGRCQSCETEPFLQVCPTISVVGPADVIRPGAVMTFTANIPNDYRGSYKWSVSAGNFESGRANPWINVRVPDESNMPSIIATVELDGISAGVLALPRRQVMSIPAATR
jgi:hypothetical protein